MMVKAITKAAILGFLTSTGFARAEATSTTFSYAFPTTDYLEREEDPIEWSGGMAHALCVLGAEDVSTTITPNPTGFSYNKIPNLKDGVQPWGNTWWLQLIGIDGNGDEVCEGGIYLQPSKVEGPASGVDVTVEAIAKDRNTDVVLCTFVEHKRGIEDREGNWKQHLLDDGFIPSDHAITFNNNQRRPLTSYCKNLSEAATATSESPTKATTASSCESDIRLKHTYGSTAFPTSSVEIISQDTDTVTVALKQAWDAPVVDKYFYSYQKSVFSNYCYEKDNFNKNDILEDITIQCLSTSAIASLTICLQDIQGIGDDFLSDDDDATVWKCCQSKAPESTPTVCYHLDIMCETTCLVDESRMLRGRIINHQDVPLSGPV